MDKLSTIAIMAAILESGDRAFGDTHLTKPSDYVNRAVALHEDARTAVYFPASSRAK